MATPDFRRAVEELWQALDMGSPPRFDESGRARMRVEGGSVLLASSPDGTGMRATADIGELPEGPAGQRLVTETLRRALGLLLVNPSALSLDPETRRVTVTGHVDLRQPLARHIAMIEAVLEAVEMLRSDFVRTGAETPPSAPPASGGEMDDSLLIFRP